MVSTLEEHLGYISDGRRMELFRQAFARAIRPGDTIADIGCGFGILGLLCLEAGAARAWGIDQTDAIEIARETMMRSGLGDSYHCIRGLSFRIELPAPVDLIVCDHVGYFGIDYGIIEVLSDARRRFLRPGGRLVPDRIQLTLAGVFAADCRDKVEAWISPGVPAQYAWLRQYGVNTKHARVLSKEAIGTDPAVLGTIDLTIDSPDLLSFTASLKALRDGALCGLGGWFDCELAEGVWMTNSPLSDSAIDRPQVFLPFDQPIEVIKGESVEISLSIRHDTGLITWNVRDPRTGRRQKQSTWNSRILSEADLERNPARPLELNRDALARQIVCGYVDGARTAREIEHVMLRDHPDLFPSAEEIVRFVRKELSDSAR